MGRYMTTRPPPRRPPPKPAKATKATKPPQTPVVHAPPRQPKHIRYALGSEQRTCSVAPTYEDAIKLALRAFPELWSLDRSQITFSVAASSGAQDDGGIAPSAWEAAMLRLQPSQVIRIHADYPTLVLQDVNGQMSLPKYAEDDDVEELERRRSKPSATPSTHASTSSASLPPPDRPRPSSPPLSPTSSTGHPVPRPHSPPRTLASLPQTAFRKIFSSSAKRSK